MSTLYHWHPWDIVTPSPLHSYLSAIFDEGGMILEAPEFLLRTITREHNAFHALLAVAKKTHPTDSECRLCQRVTHHPDDRCPINQLSVFYPGWREWA